jgi:SWI/SNF-related matrix-associated actin-dependent regulator of chromatin subfamily A-like protein 1
MPIQSITTQLTTPADIARGLFPHQVEGVAFLLKRRRAILADDMGLGKTRQAITALKVEEPAGPYLVICPASVKRNWAREIEMVLPGAAVRLLGGAGDDAPLPGAEWVVVNYDVLKKQEARLAATPWRGVVLDEAHYVRNQKSQRSRSARRIVDVLDDPVVYLLTGTPLLNRPRDLFSLLQLAGHPLGRSFLSYAKRYCAAYQGEFGWVTDGASNLDELAVQLQGLLLRRTKDEVLDLPPKIRSWLPVDVPADTGTAGTRQVLRLLLAARGIDVPGTPATDAGGPGGRARILAALSTLRHELAVAKVPQTLELLDGIVEQGQKAIVFTSFDASAKALHKHFGGAAVLLTGATPAGKRQALVDRFQDDPEVTVFVANLVAGGVGLNLTAATHVVFNDLDWVPANHWQAEDRAYRIGQERTVNVSYLVAAGTVDDFVETVLQTKAALVGAVVDGGALDQDAGDVLSELERLVGALSPRLADTRLDDLEPEEISALLREASARAAPERPEATGEAATPRSETEAMRKAMELLREALRGPSSTRYQAESTSGRGTVYDLTADAAGDIHCSCPGFEFRGACNHARRLKQALSNGDGLPAGIRAVATHGESTSTRQASHA